MRKLSLSIFFIYCLTIVFLNIANADVLKLTTLNSSTIDAPYSGEVCSYSNEVCHDITKFYEKDNIDFVAGLTYIKSVNKNHSIGLRPTYYNGYESKKYNIDPALILGTNYFYTSDDKMTNFSLGFNLGTVIGGKISEDSCKDSLNREYHCGSLRAWNEVEKSSDTFGNNKSINFVWKKKF